MKQQLRHAETQHGMCRIRGTSPELVLMLQDFRATELRNTPNRHRPPNVLPCHYEIWFQKRPFLIMTLPTQYSLKQEYSTGSAESLVLDDNNVKILHSLSMSRQVMVRANVAYRLRPALASLPVAAMPPMRGIVATSAERVANPHMRTIGDETPMLIYSAGRCTG